MTALEIALFCFSVLLIAVLVVLNWLLAKSRTEVDYHIWYNNLLRESNKDLVRQLTTTPEERSILENRE